MVKAEKHMHELGLLVQMAETVEKVAAENHIEKVTVVALDIGEASGAMPELFTECFPVVREQHPVLEEAELQFRMIPSKALCLACDALYDVMKQEGKCPVCGSGYKKVIGGQEVVIREIGY